MRFQLFAVSVFLAIAQAANHTGPLRPQVHYSPTEGFMNDPNGMFYDAKREIYHYYYQCEQSEYVLLPVSNTNRQPFQACSGQSALGTRYQLRLIPLDQPSTGHYAGLRGIYILWISGYRQCQHLWILP